VKQTWLSPRAISLHIAVLVTVPGFLALGWWQLHRALSGNGLSWAYTVEWPFFCVYAVVMWWKLVHDVAADRRARDAGDGTASTSRFDGRPVERAASSTRKLASTTRFETETETETDLDGEAAAYNSYLRFLNASPRSRRR